jgi:hypothetical protein
MAKLLEYFQSNPLVYALGGVVVLLLVHFFLQYIVRGLALRSRLIASIARVSDLGPQNAGAVRARLEEIFRDTRLARAWREFSESLHEQQATDGQGQPLVAIRATQPAESFFNLETVVDPWIGSEYFKHLPGILTGLGIIGTFFGLIQGLLHFNPSLTNSADLQRGLGQLFGHVRDAFIFSGTAIAAAIAVTITEKWLYSSCAKWVLELASTLEAIFRPGVGEEYLASILTASRDNAVQVRHLRESLAGDLRELLTGLSDRHIQATQQLSSDLGRSIRESLKEPLADIARSVAAASGRDTEAIRDALEHLMTSFMTQMRETMGSQMQDLSALIQQTTQAVQKVELAMQGLLEDVQTSGKDSASSIQSAAHELVRRLSDSQRTQHEVISGATREVLVQLNQAVARIAATQESALRGITQGNEATATHLRRQITGLTDSHVASVEAMHELLHRFGGVSADLVEKLNSGSAAVVNGLQSVQQVSEQLSRVGLELSSLERQNLRSSNDLVRASSHLAAAAQNVGSSIHQLSNAAIRFEGVATSASVEANARRQLLLSLQDVIDQSQMASREFVALAQETRKALGARVQHFESDVESVLAEHMKAYQRQLGESAGSLRQAIDQLAARANRTRP